MTGRIFVNYRRDDSKGEALALRTALVARLPRFDIFMDVDGGIRPGENYVRVLDERIAGTDVFLCLIGQRWLTAADQQANLRLENADDFVRIEISSALKRDIPIIPVLIDDTQMPREHEMPDLIRLIAVKQAMRLRHDRFNADIDGIATAIKSYCAAAKPRGVSYAGLGLSVLAALALGAAGVIGAQMLTGRGLESDGRAAQRIKALESEGREIAESLSSKQDELSRANARLAETAADLAKARADAERLVRSAGDAKSVQSQVAVLGTQLDAQKKATTTAQGQVAQLEQQLSESNRRLADTESKLSAAEKRATDALARVKDLEGRLAVRPSADASPKTPPLQASTAMAERGAWIKKFNVNLKASTPPKIFYDYFLVVEGDGAYLGNGAIVVGANWDSSDAPGWKVVHGYVTLTSMGYAYGTASNMTHLGASWRPEFAALSDEVNRLRGGKTLGTRLSFGKN